jgi:predicted nucleic acid-binding protein
VTDPIALVDTNVLVDVLFNDPVWAAWSAGQLDRLSTTGPLAINDVVYAELSVQTPSIEALDQSLQEAQLTIAVMPRAALFLAAKAFQSYRARGGPRSSLLPDFFIGAQAATMGIPLLSRDPRRYRTYFPSLALIAP